MGSVLVFRPWPARALHIVGQSPLAGEFRRLITSGAAPGWHLHPVPQCRTPLDVLAGPLLRRTGSRRFYNILDRHGFAYVEEVAATPDACLLELRNSGPRMIAAVRAVISELGPADALTGTAGTSSAARGQGRVPGSHPGCPAARRGRRTAGRRGLGHRRTWRAHPRGSAHPHPRRGRHAARRRPLLGPARPAQPPAAGRPGRTGPERDATGRGTARPNRSAAPADPHLPHLRAAQAHLRFARLRAGRQPRARPPARGRRAHPARPGRAASPVRPAALAGSLNSTARHGRPHSRCAAMDGQADVLAGKQDR